jgi:hypothetical protein
VRVVAGQHCPSYPGVRKPEQVYPAIYS